MLSFLCPSFKSKQRIPYPSSHVSYVYTVFKHRSVSIKGIFIKLPYIYTLNVFVIMLVYSFVSFSFSNH